MASGMMGIGTSGLLAAQQQLSTTGHNISNVNTEGFARQRTEQSTSQPKYTGSGYIGTGTQIETTRRFYSEFLEEQIRSSNSQLGKFEKYNELASQIDNILANPDAGLTPTIEAFYNALQEANDYPSGVPSRSVLLTSANTMTDRFSLLQDRLVDLNNQTNSNLSDTAAEVTARASSIAGLNQKIALEVGIGNGNLPNDTLDKREQLIKEISERIDVSVVYQDNGMVNLFIGSGQPLVLGSNAFEMSVRDSQYTSKNKDIYLSSGNSEINITSQIRGGELQGLMDFKSQVLEPSFNSLGRIAASISQEMNDQQNLGLTLQQDANGNYIQGGNFFNNITDKYTGPSFQITDIDTFETSNYQLTYDGTNYNLFRYSNDTGVLSGSLATGASLDAFNTNLNTNGLGMQFDTGIVVGTFDIKADGQSALPSDKNSSASPQYNILITDTAVLTTSDYELSYDNTSATGFYKMTRLSDNVVFSGNTIDLLNADLSDSTANFPKGPQGIQIAWDLGSPVPPPVNGDKFLVQPTHELSQQIGVEIYDVLDIALASPILASEPTDNLGVGTNKGTGTLDFIPMKAPTTIDNVPITDGTGALTNFILTYNGTGFNVSSALPTASPTVNAGPIPYNPSTDSGVILSLGPIGVYDNISFTVTGSPDTGDSFIIGNNTSPQDDNRNGLIMADIQTKKTLDGGNSDFQRAYGLLVSDVGTKTQSSEVDLQAQTTLSEQAKQNRDSLSGVNLDEEASNLLRFQQAYQASSKVITVANDIFNTLLNAT
jgi:flagellar hook-associated protein 1 FlgK